MIIHYYNRNQQCGFSINKVTQCIKTEISKYYTTKDIFMPTHRAYPWHCLKNIIYTLQHRKYDKEIINHQTGDNHYILLGLIGSKTVLTVHDLVYLNCKNPLKRFYKYLFYIYLPVKIADKIICISNQTKRELLKHIKTDKACVIYNPINPEYQYIPKEFNTKCPRILHIGTGWNKNLKNVILAIKDIRCELRIIGRLNQETKLLLEKYNINYSNRSNLSDDEIRNEYIQADIISFPSIYEGFGMPIIEGQAIGRIVVTSSIEPIMEISNKASILVNPNDVNDIKEGFLKAIHDTNLRNHLIKLGQENIKRFKPEKIAKQYIDLYKSLINPT